MDSYSDPVNTIVSNGCGDDKAIVWCPGHTYRPLFILIMSSGFYRRRINPDSQLFPLKPTLYFLVSILHNDTSKILSSIKTVISNHNDTDISNYLKLLTF